MPDILESILHEIPKGAIESATFEGANIVLYVSSKDFFLEHEQKIRDIVEKIKKRVEVRASQKLLLDKEKTEQIIRKIIPEEAEITNIIFDVQRSIVVIETAKPGLAIGKGGEKLREIRESTFWLPEVQRSPAIRSKITENIRNVLYLNNVYRKKFLNSIGKRIYKEWSPEKREEWIRLGFLGGGRQVGRSCLFLHTPESRVLLDCGVDVASETEKFPYLNVPEFDLKQLDAVIISHAHLDHSGLVPYLYKMGYRGPTYMSVDYAEPLLIKEGGIIKKVKIGEFIDNVLKNSVDIEKAPYYEYNAAMPSDDVEAVAFSNSDFKLRFKKIKKVIRHKICEGDTLYKIKVRTNRSITVTGSHSVFVLKEGEIKEAKVSELKEGDYLIVPHKLPSINTIKEIDLSVILSEFNQNGDEISPRQGHKIPKTLKISKELMRILGYFTAEGNFDKRSLQFSFDLKEISYVKELEKDIKYVFGISPKIRVSKGNVLRVDVNSKLLKELFSRFFFKGCVGATTKRIPEIIFNVPNELKLQFLKAYFRGDGTINYHNQTAVAMSVSKELISDLAYLCSQIGFNYYTYEGYMGKTSKTSNKVYQLVINLKDFFDKTKICMAKTNLIPLKEILFDKEWYYHRLKTKLHITKERLISLLNSQSIKYKGSMQIKNTLFRLASSDLSFLPIVEIKKVKPTNGYVYDISVEGDQNFVGGEMPICLHNTAPTRDIAALLALDYIGVAYKKATAPLFSSTDIKDMVRHSICLNYNEVTDITPDLRLTFYNAGHALGSAIVHINIGNGLHNLVYSSDMKYGKTRLLEPAATQFPRCETLVLESTYGGRADILPSRAEAEELLLRKIKETIERKGKVLIPELGVGRSQETMLILEQAINKGILEKVPVYVDGMIWDITAIHTAYPDFLSNYVKSQIFHNKNPFSNEMFKRVGSVQERQEVIEGGPCIILATSGMLVGGASVEYFRNIADSAKNTIIFVCYQGIGSLGRQIQEGLKEARFVVEGREEIVPVNLDVCTIDGLTAHSSRAQLLAFVNNMQPKPKRIIVNHGEPSKCLDLASTLYQLYHVETSAPHNLEITRLR